MIPRLYIVADREGHGSDADWLGLVERLARSCRAPAALQIRARSADFSVRARAVAIARRPGARVFLNGTSAEALESGADGVHWPESLIPPDQTPIAPVCRAASVHSVAAARNAIASGADFLVFAPVFAPSSKPGAGVGLGALAEVTQCSTRPVLALGGVTPERVSECLAAGAYGVAVLGGVMNAPDPIAALTLYLEALSCP